jgi:hypothetical protein
MTAPITDAALAELERLATHCAAGVWPNPLQHLDDDLRVSVDRKVGHLLLALIARLRAAERAREAEGWRSIETAPDDRDVLLKRPAEGRMSARYSIGAVRRFDDGGPPLFLDWHWADALPTLWRDIEPPPAPRAEVG